MQWITLFAGLLVCPITSAINITFTMQPGDLEVQEGNAFRLSCNISVEGDADNITSQFYWEKDGEFFRNGSVLLVSSAEDSHSGVYVCVVRVENGDEMRSRNATVTVNTSDEDPDLVPLIAMIVCVTGVTLIFTLLYFTIGLYMCCCRSGGNLSVWRDKTSWYQHHQQTNRERHIISSRKFSNRLRSKSKSLSQLLHSSAEEFPLDVTLHKGSSNVLSGSQPTQTTDIEDPSALDFDLALDERMFEHEAPQKPHSNSNSIDRANQKTAFKGRRAAEQSNSERRASEGQLVFPEAMGTSRKSILKESKSFNDGLHNQRRSSAVSDMSSDITQSDENSLHLGKSVRFNMSGDDLAAADSGVHTGTSTPHNIPVERRASEPETLSHQFSNSERRGSAPGDLVSEIGSPAAGWESGKHMYTQDRLDIEDEGLATGSEEWSQNEKNSSFEETQAKKQFESGFSQLDKEAETDTSTAPNVKPDHESPPLPGIATRVAHLLSASQKHNKGNFTRGPSTLTTSSHTAVVSKLKVSEIKERYLQESRGKIEETGHTGKEEGRRLSISKLVQERSELFKEKNDKENSRRTHKQLQDRHSDGHQIEVNEGTEQSANMQPDSSSESIHNQESTPQASNDESFPSGLPINIPIFSAPSGLSNWVPACLRGTVVSPYSYDGDEQEQVSDDSEFEDDDGLVMEPLKPTIGRDMLRAQSTMPFGGVASFSPIGRSWLSSGKPSGPAVFPLVNKPKTPGASEKSPFNESFSLQRGHTPRIAAINRLSVIPEETASACGSATDVDYL